MGNAAIKTHVKERGENPHRISRWETEEKVTYITVGLKEEVLWEIGK